jgi:hypothetical protein
LAAKPVMGDIIPNKNTFLTGTTFLITVFQLIAAKLKQRLFRYRMIEL